MKRIINRVLKPIDGICKSIENIKIGGAAKRSARKSSKRKKRK